MYNKDPGRPSLVGLACQIKPPNPPQYTPPVLAPIARTVLALP
jgi:hypothetical protein